MAKYGTALAEWSGAELYARRVTLAVNSWPTLYFTAPDNIEETNAQKTKCSKTILLSSSWRLTMKTNTESNKLITISIHLQEMRSSAIADWLTDCTMHYVIWDLVNCCKMACSRTLMFAVIAAIWQVIYDFLLVVCSDK